MKRVLQLFLEEAGQPHMTEYLTYCLNELVSNAIKANTKRIYFAEKKLNIQLPHDYQAGMNSFKDETHANIWYYLKLQKEAGLYIKFFLQCKDNMIYLEVRNNAELTVFEYKRMHDKLERARNHDSVEETALQLLDNTEGAGLGITIMILMLKKLRMPYDNFKIICKNNETAVSIGIPIDKNQMHIVSVISSEIIDIIERLPSFPENIVAITKLINDRDAKMSEIAQRISEDIGLTADLLKLVNSPTFRFQTPCTNITEAVKMIGIRGIQNLLYSIGSIQNFADINDQKASQFWTHSRCIAFYSYNLARNLCHGNRRIRENSYVCGLLHDIGKIIYHLAYPLIGDAFIETCRKKGIPLDVLEKMSSGISHGEIGAMVGKKWNFPQAIINVITYHHSPENAPQQDQELTKLVYLANLIYYYQDGKVNYNQFDKRILQSFGIVSEKQLSVISNRLKKAFQAEFKQTRQV